MTDGSTVLEPSMGTLDSAGIRGEAGGGLPEDVGSWLRRASTYAKAGQCLKYQWEGNGLSEELSYQQLDEQARRLAAWLISKGQAGDRVLLAHAPGLEFVAGFFACLYAGMIAVPAYPPRRTRHGDRLAAVLLDCGARLALAERVGCAALAKVAADGGPWSGMVWPQDGEALPEPLAAERCHRPRPQDLAFLQYTSGSTGTPKGVMVSHANLAHNVATLSVVADLGPADVMVNWLPLFHDMGLIMGLLLPISQGARCVLLSPADFLKRPRAWLEAFTRERGTHAAAPDFAYRLCAALPPEERQGLDLSAWRCAVNAAEPVRVATLRAFAEAFQASGFDPAALTPSYGLAENTLVVTGRRGDAWTLATEGRGADARELVTCGSVFDQRVRIVDPRTLRECAPGCVGEVWVQGRSNAQGYWKRADASRETFGAKLEGRRGTHLRTGDLGFLHRGQLVISGRLKDLVILRGVNHYPQDLEECAGRVAPGALLRSAAFSVDGPEGEALVLVQEAQNAVQTTAQAQAVAAALAQAHGVSATVLLVPKLSVPMTSSGKVQRRACRQLWLDGQLNVKAQWPLPALDAPAGMPADLAAWAQQRLTGLGGQEPPQGWREPLDAWGLDSLRMAQFAADLEARLGRRLDLVGRLQEPLDQIFHFIASNPGVGTPLAGARGWIEAAGAGPSAPAASAISAPALRRWRAHAALEGLWAAQQAQPGSSAYHISWTVQLQGRPDHRRLQQALAKVQASQASLRCGFVAEGDQLWLQEQPAPVMLAQPWHDDGPLEAANAWCQGWQDQPFDPTAAPLWRAALLPLEGGASLLAFCFHHLIFDQRSLEAFYLALERAWNDPASALEGFGPPLREMEPLQLEQGRAYWSSRLRGLKAASWSGHGATATALAPRRLKAVVEAPLLQALRQAAAAQRCTLFAAAAAAWAESLAALDGAVEACFVSPFTLRDQPLSAKQVGYWVHPLPLRLSADPHCDPATRLREAGEAVRGALAHRDLSLSQALRAAHAPLPEAFLVLQGELEAPAHWLGSPARTAALAASGAKAALALTLSGEGAWSLELEHDPARVDPRVAQNALHGFEQSLRRLAGWGAHDDDGPAAVGLALKGESLEPSEHASVLQAFHCQVERRPGAPALLWQGGQWDYATLAARARAVARSLADHGVRAGDRIGVCSAAGPAWAAAVLACFELSAIYVPLDPTYPPERLRCMVEDAGCRVVLGLGERPDVMDPACWLSLADALLARPPWARPAGQPTAADPAYVIFTSGSSGRPKGVQVGHGALLQHARGFARRLRLSAQDRVLQFVSISFDPSLEELLPALVEGAAVALPQRLGAPSATELAAWLKAWKVSVLHLPAAYWHAFMAAGGEAALARCPELRALVTGGEAPDPRWVKALAACLRPDAVFINAYGPTEACISALSWEQPLGQADGVSPLPLGRPLPGVQAAVVDDEGGALGPGSSGELWLAGGSLAQGYLGPQGLRQDGFIHAGPDGGPERRWYRTGDRVELDDAGRLHYRGRLDRQVKVSGIRLDLEEMEQLLRGAPGVAHAVVGAQGQGEALKLHAWVVPDPHRPATEADLRGWLARSLPAPALPHQWNFCAELPLNANGKLDRAALLVGVRSDAQLRPAAPPAPAEGGEDAATVQALCQAFAAALNRPTVGPDEDFFSLGGSSLRAVRLAGEAGQRLGRELRIELLYQHSSPRALAAAMQGRTISSGGEGVLRSLAGRSGPDLLLLPPVSGRLDCYADLAQHLGADARVWGLDLLRLPMERAQDWDGLVQAAAQAVAGEMKGRDLVVAGWSMGGLLAADLARALPPLGVRVSRLGLFDSVLPDPLMAALVQADPAALDELVSRDLPGGSADEPTRRRYRLHARLLGQFQARRLEVPLTLALSERTAAEQHRHGLLAWALLAGRGMSTLLLPGDHFSIMQGPGLARLAARLLADAALDGRGHDHGDR